MSDPSNTVKLTLLNSTGYIFNANEYMTLRTKYRIVGNPIGTWSLKGWNPNICGLPVELTKNEIQILLEEKVVILLSKSKDFHIKADENTRKDFKEFIENRINTQAEIFKIEKMHRSEKYIEDILMEKKRKLLKSGIHSDIDLSKDQVLKEIEENIIFDKNNSLLDIPMEHLMKHKAEIVRISIDISLKYRVFKDLWRKGKYITSGETFGADFLLYPGDPLMFHASHVVIVLDNPVISPLALIAKCRLSVVVNKICVLAYCTNEDILYQTIDWESCKENVKINVQT